MLRECSESCRRMAEIQADQEARVRSIPSFFELEDVLDLQGRPFSFASLRGKVTVIVNVASHCGYTESHYRGLVQLWSSLRGGEEENGQDDVQILAFPCNQFGKQEPGTANDIAAFAKSKGVEFTMMEKIDVNGPTTSLVYLYLKSKTKVTAIRWNFATYFIVSPDGDITAHTGVEPMDLKPFIFELLGKDEL
jgi:glutathione peroxidase